MEISSAASQIKSTTSVQTATVRTKEVKNDNDKNDAATKPAAAQDTKAPPTVNTNGQTIGSIINIHA